MDENDIKPDRELYHALLKVQLLVEQFVDSPGLIEVRSCVNVVQCLVNARQGSSFGIGSSLLVRNPARLPPRLLSCVVTNRLRLTPTPSTAHDTEYRPLQRRTTCSRWPT